MTLYLTRLQGQYLDADNVHDFDFDYLVFSLLRVSQEHSIIERPGVSVVVKALDA